MTKVVHTNFNIPHGSSDLMLAVLFGLNISDILGTMGSALFVGYTLWKWNWEMKKKKNEENENQTK